MSEHSSVAAPPQSKIVKNSKQATFAANVVDPQEFITCWFHTQNDTYISWIQTFFGQRRAIHRNFGARHNRLLDPQIINYHVAKKWS